MHEIKFRTKQEVFNKVVRGLAKQKWQTSRVTTSYGGYIQAYLGVNNCRCAIGHLLDNVTVEAIKNAPALNTMGPLILEKDKKVVKFVIGDLPDDQPGDQTESLYDSAREQFIWGLQRAHDGARTPEEMVTRLRSFAEKHGLKEPAVLAKAITSFSKP